MSHNDSHCLREGTTCEEAQLQTNAGAAWPHEQIVAPFCYQGQPSGDARVGS